MRDRGAASGITLIVQVPCYNEEGTLGKTIADIPRWIEGVDRVLILVIDDGSTDGTVEVARQAGADCIVRHRANRGLARTFQSGIDASLRLGADIVVNTDADNQYPGDQIGKLIRPILEGAADIVIGDRRPYEAPHFSFTKRTLQRWGSRVVRRLSETDVPDAVSGFRALSREACLRMNVVSTFSYTIEMLIQAGSKGLAIESVPVETNRVTRPSRLFSSVPEFLARSAETTARVYTMYRPLRVFMALGLATAIVGGAPILRFLYFWALGEGAGHIQSLVLGGVLITSGLMLGLIGLLADMISFNRRLIEMTLEHVRRLELDSRAGAPRPDSSRQAPGGD